jgi:hypothetical protein
MPTPHHQTIENFFVAATTWWLGNVRGFGDRKLRIGTVRRGFVTSTSNHRTMKSSRDRRVYWFDSFMVVLDDCGGPSVF